MFVFLISLSVQQIGPMREISTHMTFGRAKREKNASVGLLCRGGSRWKQSLYVLFLRCSISMWLSMGSCATCRKNPNDYMSLFITLYVCTGMAFTWSVSIPQQQLKSFSFVETWTLHIFRLSLPHQVAIWFLEHLHAVVAVLLNTIESRRSVSIKLDKVIYKSLHSLVKSWKRHKEGISEQLQNLQSSLFSVRGKPAESLRGFTFAWTPLSAASLFGFKSHFRLVSAWRFFQMALDHGLSQPRACREFAKCENFDVHCTRGDVMKILYG